MKEAIAKLLAKELAGRLKEEEILASLETPANAELGDIAFPCFKLAPALKKNPAEIAKQLQKKIGLCNGVEKAEAKGPYLNFFISKKLLAEQVLRINESFGRQKNGGKILLEHTSTNPNASPHVGRARNSVIGDSIYRILTFLGNSVERHYYINDVSKQVAMLALYFNKKDSFESMLKKYVEASKKIKDNPKLEQKVFGLLHKFEHKDPATTKLFEKIVETAVKGQKKIFSAIGIDFDYFDYESRYMASGHEILKELDKTGKLFKDREGRLVLDQKGTGLEWKMKSPVLVLTRSDGTGLYVLRDLAYTIDKCKKGRNILVLGEDQKLYFEQLKQALIVLKKPCPEVVHYSYVLLKDAGKMSTRSGEVVLLEEFVSEAVKKAKKEIAARKTKGDAMKIGVGAIKYAMLRNDNDKNITFDWQQALNFEGDSGPYLQYSYARANSILKKAEKTKNTGKARKNEKAEAKIPAKLNDKELGLIKKMLEFPAMVQDAAKQFSPSVIANYSFSLAQAFNEFYHDCKVIGSDEEAFRLRLVEAFRITIKNALYLLGIEVMEEM